MARKPVTQQDIDQLKQQIDQNKQLVDDYLHNYDKLEKQYKQKKFKYIESAITLEFDSSNIYYPKVGYPRHSDMPNWQCHLNNDVAKACSFIRTNLAKVQRMEKQLDKQQVKQAELKSGKIDRYDPKLLPEALIKFYDSIVEANIEFVKQMREKYKGIHPLSPKYKSLDDQQQRWVDKYRNITNTEIKQQVEEQSQQVIVDLYNRVIDKCGKITDASDLKVTQGNQDTVINGKIFGEKANVVVKSIAAGGYNIQRFHIRTTIRAVK